MTIEELIEEIALTKKRLNELIDMLILACQEKENFISVLLKNK